MWVGNGSLSTYQTSHFTSKPSWLLHALGLLATASSHPALLITTLPRSLPAA